MSSKKVGFWRLDSRELQQAKMTKKAFYKSALILEVDPQNVSDLIGFCPELLYEHGAVLKMF